MSPPAAEDPKRESEAEAEAAAGHESIEEIASQGDLEGLLALARVFRAGSPTVPRDLKKCLQCYTAAIALGSAEAEHAAALFHLAGGVVPQDAKVAASLFRSSAGKGHLPSKVYVANLYELGIHYKADTEKADVWYRNAARGAGIDVDLPEYVREMADLGCVRFCLKLIEDPETSEEDRVYFRKKAKAFGWRDKTRPSHVPAEPVSHPDTASQEAELDSSPRVSKVAPKKKAPAPRAVAKPASNVGTALMAFVYATLFVGASLGFGYLARAGVHVLEARYGTLPVLGTHPDAIVGAVTAALAMLGAMMPYRAGTVFKSALVAALFAGAGHMAWRSPGGVLFAVHTNQVIAFGVAGFMGALFVFGLMGGAKTKTRDEDDS